MRIHRRTLARLLAGAALAALLHGPAWAASEPDLASSEALIRTVELLTQADARKAAVGKSAEARAADEQVAKVAGSSEHADEIYALAAEIFKDLVAQTGGDVAKLQEAMRVARENPKGFAERLSERNKAALSAIARKIEAGSAQTR